MSVYKMKGSASFLLALLVLTISRGAEANLGALAGAANAVLNPLTGPANPAFGGGLLSGPGNLAAASAPGLGGLAGGLGGGLGGVLSGVAGTAGGLASGVLGAGVGGAAAGALGGVGGAAANAVGGVGNLAANAIGGVGGAATGLVNGILGGPTAGFAPGILGGALAGASGLVGGASSAVGGLAAGTLGGLTGTAGAAAAGAGAAGAAAAAAAGNPMFRGHGLPGPFGVFPGAGSGAAAAMGAAVATNAAANAAAGANGLGMANPLASAQLASGSGLGRAAATAATLAATAPVVAAADNLVGASSLELGREQLSNDAFDNAQAEAAIAGADMTAHGANNARSASLAGNAYRQAKLASARDRVNIAGTVQNSARISDAAIATHDAATKAEDSLLGSELAVDSAATVLDSDAAYIPPVTNSLLRSLPYGRLGLRNIVPKPLTYPSSLLPDVWLNGLPVNYLNAPLRSLQYGFRGSLYGGWPYGLGGWTSLGLAGAGPLPFDQIQSNGEAAGYLLNGQPFWASNGWPINALVMDPMGAYLANGPMFGSSIIPILANGQLEAQDEIAAADMLTMQQQNGAGMLSTYFGFGRMNPVPLLTGTISEVNLAPTTTIGTTYPIGSALVIEPRDSYFQDYIDNASSRQNYDEREQ